MKSIQTKFIILILTCVLISSIVIGGAGILNAKKVVDEDSTQIMNLLCSDKVKEVDALLSRIEQSVKTVFLYTQKELDSVERLKTDKDYVKEYTKKLEMVAVNAAGNTEGALAVYVRFNPEFTEPTSGLFWSKTQLNGNFQQLTPTDFSGYNPSDIERVGWYYVPVKNGIPTWMEPYHNKNINVNMISYVIPLYVENETLGVVGMDIDFGIIEDMIDSVKVYKSGYAFLSDKHGKIVHHNTLSMNTNIGKIEDELRALENELANDSNGSALFEYNYKGQDKKMAFRTLNNGMRLVITAPVSEIDEAKNGLILQISIAIIIICTLSVVITISMTRKMIRPLKELNSAAKRIAEGDLSISLTQQTKDEVGTLAESFQQTVEHLQKYISYINGLAYRDSLTGVKNKTAYQEAERKMEERMRTEQPEFAVVVLDINGLKLMNDTFGHDFGDILILESCKLICKVFKHSPVYRVGGDEFVVILENVDYEHYIEVLADFEKAMEEYNEYVRPDNRLSIARGIAVYNRETDLVFGNVFKRADEAMYQNKAMMKKRQEEKNE